MLALRLSMLALALSLVHPAGAHAQKREPPVKEGEAVDTVVAIKPFVPADTAWERRWREETATLAGTIRDAETGLPLRANVIPEDGWEFTDSLGQYTAEGQEPGRQTVVIEQRGFLAERRTVELAAGQTTTLDVSLRRAPAPCCALTGSWRVRFVLARRGGMGPAPSDSVV
ncbi:MAG TPA: carboxypeptidase-like regulatory domain-containing protein, partial [Longimicrobium sp.]|nr:carboxypeptidase-like regulatory domain-containing protein [Longimicrobium sp.]